MTTGGETTASLSASRKLLSGVWTTAVGVDDTIAPVETSIFPPPISLKHGSGSSTFLKREVFCRIE